MYPEPLAEQFKKKAGQKWRPIKTIEGERFKNLFCYQCIDYYQSTENDKLCKILHNTMIHDKLDEKYPEEWQIDKNGQPTCTAFKIEQAGARDCSGESPRNP